MDLFVERGFDAKQFFIPPKLMPNTIGGTRIEGQIILVRAKVCRRTGSPGGRLPFSARAGPVAYIGVGLEG